MVFSSLEFIFIFLPIFYLVYAAAPKRAKNTCLFLASLVFYAIGVFHNPYYLPLFIMTMMVNFLLGLGVERGGKWARFLLTMGILYNVAQLFVFKYLSFVGEAIAKCEIIDFVLPLGISFYAFQCISYLVDVFKGAGAEHSFVNFGSYIACFPKLTAGPITRYGEMKGQIADRTVTRKDVGDGICYFVFGLGLKVLLANRLGGLWNDINGVGFDAITTATAWLGILAFSLQIYFDFWGYSLMAVGLSKTIGYHLPKNFDYPYTALTMTDFWRRWHITLGAWFREYVYIPLGGNRKGSVYFHLFAVWFLTGIWHGASLNFVLWGLFLFALIAMEKAGMYGFFNKHKLAGRSYMFLAILISWLLFATEDMSSFAMYGRNLIGMGGEFAFAGDFLKYLRKYGHFLLIGTFLATSLPRRIYPVLREKKWMLVPALVCIGGLSIYFVYKGMNDPFMYFKF